MCRLVELVMMFELAQSRQSEASATARAFANADLPLLAESYFVECRKIGVEILAIVDELKAMDKLRKGAA